MENNSINSNTWAGTLGGTALVVILNITTEILHTALLAGVGAIVSFGVSISLKYVVKWFGRK